MIREIPIDLCLDAGAAWQPRDRDMRQIGAAFRRQADRLERAIDLLVQPVQRVVWRNAGPDRICPARLVEPADAVERDGDRLRADMAERCGNVFGLRSFDFADEAQGQMQLIVVLPARMRHPRHDAAKRRADRGGRAKGDE